MTIQTTLTLEEMLRQGFEGLDFGELRGELRSTADEHFYLFTGAPGESYEFSLTGDGFDALLGVYEIDGAGGISYLGEADVFGIGRLDDPEDVQRAETFRVTAPPDAHRTWLVQVDSFGDPEPGVRGSDLRRVYEIAASGPDPRPLPPGDRVSDDPAEPLLLAADTALAERIDGDGDVDIYRVLLRGGRTQTVLIEHPEADRFEFALTHPAPPRYDAELPSVAPTGSGIAATFFAFRTGFYDFAVSGPAGDTPYAITFDSGERDYAPEIPGVLSLRDVQRVALLYEAGLNRPAQEGGLNFWVDRREQGLTERDLAQRFLASPEFTALNGPLASLGDRELVEILFRNVLDRDGAEGGITFWEDRLAEADFDRIDLLIAFAVSPENVVRSPRTETLVEDTPGTWVFAEPVAQAAAADAFQVDGLLG